MVSIINSWKLNIDNKLVTLGLFVDLKKAFDLINPKFLFHKLFHYGFDNVSLNLFRNFFENRVQVCRVMNAYSSPVDNSTGVGQGFVTGPLLFLIYINDLSMYTDLNCYLFGDDTSLYSSGIELDDVIKIIQIIHKYLYIAFNNLIYTLSLLSKLRIFNQYLSNNLKPYVSNYKTLCLLIEPLILNRLSL